MTNIDSENWLGATYEGNAEHSAGMLDVNRFFGILRSNLNILFSLLNKIEYEPTASKTVNPSKEEEEEEEGYVKSGATSQKRQSS